MLKTNNKDTYILCGNHYVYKSRKGFIYACENKILIVTKYLRLTNNFRVYHEGDLMTIEQLSAFFNVSYNDIVKWRNHVWNNVYSNKTRIENLHVPAPKTKPIYTDKQSQQDLFGSMFNEIVLHPNKEPKECCLRSITIPKHRPLTSGCFVVDEPREPWKSLFSQFIEVRMTQTQRLARVKQKQREYCLNYGMPESLIERNVAFAVTKFYEEEDKQDVLKAKKKALLAHNINMLGLQIKVEKEGYDKYDREANLKYKQYKEALRKRSVYFDAGKGIQETLENKQAEMLSY